MRRLGVVLTTLLIALPGIASAQIDSREGIALQNQILQLRQELEMLRRGGLAPPQPQGGSSLGMTSPRAPSGAPQGELVGSLLERVQRLEEDLRLVRGRAEESEFRERQLRERVEKLEGDIDFRLQQLEGGQRRGDAAPSRPAQPAQQAAPAQPPAPAAPRTPQRALADGQAALARRDFGAAEASAREVIASRDAARQVDAQILLGDALTGKRDFAAAAIAYDDARRRSPRGSRSAEATVGIANAFVGLSNNRDACTLLNELRGSNLSGPVADRAAEVRRRAQCR
jgi:TolA-binding protein